MRERPILFSAPMVKAILAGKKTQTRRIVDLDRLRVRVPEAVRSDLWDELPGYMRRLVKPGVYQAHTNPHFAVSAVLPTGEYLGLRPGEFDFVCPYADCVTRHRGGGWKLDPIGEQRLWVRETWRTEERFDEKSPTAIAKACREAGWDTPWAPIEYLADGHVDNSEGDEPWGKTRVSIHMPRWASRLTLEITSVRVERLADISEEDAKSEGVEPFKHDPEGDFWTARPRGEMHRSAFEYLWGEINGWDGEPRARAPWTTNPWCWVISFRRIYSARKGASAA
jgi:hypothetical protein